MTMDELKSSVDKLNYRLNYNSLLAELIITTNFNEILILAK